MNFVDKNVSFLDPAQVLDRIVGEEDESINVLLINEVKKYSILYDFNHEKYTDKDVRAKIWSRISADLGISEKEAKHLWKRLRDSLRDALKRQENKMGMACRKTWRYYKKMEFVIPFMTNRECMGTSSGKSKRNRNRGVQDPMMNVLTQSSSGAFMPKAVLVQGGSGTAGVSYSGLSAPVPYNLLDGSRSPISYGAVSSTYNAQSTGQGTCSSQQRVNADGSYYHGNTSNRNGTGNSIRLFKTDNVEVSLLEELAHKPVDEDLYFCLSMAASMKRLTEQRRAKLKCDMMSLLYSAQSDEAFP